MRPAARTLCRLLALFLAAAGLLACAAPGEPEPPIAAPQQFELEAVGFDQLAGWREDDPSAALAAFRRSCAALQDRADVEPMGQNELAGRVGEWRRICRAAGDLPEDVTAAAARDFFEVWFQPYRVSAGGALDGLITGYYEPLLQGSRRYRPPYTVPLYQPPDDLIRVDLGRFDPDLRGRTIAGRIAGNDFVPYHSRADIEAGALAGRELELLWVDDPIDTFFLQIQGSGQVRLDDGSLVRVGYAGQNGHPYRAIGRDLIEIGVLEREQVSLQAIRAWLEAHPRDARQIMARNRSYIFFREHDGLAPDAGPIGAQGVPLTPGRSLAVDLRYIPLGAPVWLETTAPWPEGPGPFNRLMIAQDTGGAIKGVVRGDVFFGTGERAEWTAGHMKQKGRYTVFLPKGLIPVS